jgi:hypothetical protein
MKRINLIENIKNNDQLNNLWFIADFD